MRLPTSDRMYPASAESSVYRNVCELPALQVSYIGSESIAELHLFRLEFGVEEYTTPEGLQRSN